MEAQAKLTKRREHVFGTAVVLAGLSIIGLCVMPYVLPDTTPISIFPSVQQEKFFFNVFGMIFASWLLSWVAGINEWRTIPRAAQWLGVMLLCFAEAMLVNVWKDVLPSLSSARIGEWLAPLILQTYLAGCFFAFFTLPGLTQSGNKRLTGLATLLILLPWLLASDLVHQGAEYLHGLRI